MPTQGGRRGAISVGQPGLVPPAYSAATAGTAVSSMLGTDQTSQLDSYFTDIFDNKGISLDAAASILLQ